MSGYRLQLGLVLLAVAAGFRIGFGLATGGLFLAAAITNLVIVTPLFFGSSAAAAGAGAGASDILVVASVPVAETGQSDAMNWADLAQVDIAFLLDTDDTWAGVTPINSTHVTAGQMFVGKQTGITVVAKRGLTLTVEEKRIGAFPMVRVEAMIGDQAVALYAMNLLTPGTNSEATRRNDALSEIARQASAETIPVAVIGGVGASQWSHAFGILEGEGDLVDSSRGHGFQPSSPGDFWIGFRVPNHHLLHSSALTTTDRHIDAGLGHPMRILQATLAESR